MMRHDQGGYIVVETILCFVLFVFLMLSILSLINIVALQARIHYALTQAAETVSMYSYVLHVTGADKHIQNSARRAENMRDHGDALRGNINQIMDGVGDLSAGDSLNLREGGVEEWLDENSGALKNVGEGAVGTVSEVKGWVDSVVKEPKDALQNLLNYGLNDLGSLAFGELMRPLVGRYLTNGGMDGDAFLRAFHVRDGLRGLKFTNLNPLATKTNADGSTELVTGVNNSTLLDSEGNVWITVTYKIDYTFGALTLPFHDGLEVSQSVKTKAWLGGSGG